MSEDKKGQLQVHGSLGGGDRNCYEAVERIRKIFAFGSFEKGAFTVTGIRFRQWDDKSVEDDQVEYIEKISPIEIKKCRKTQIDSFLTPEKSPSCEASLEPDSMRLCTHVQTLLQKLLQKLLNSRPVFQKPPSKHWWLPIDFFMRQKATPSR